MKRPVFAANWKMNPVPEDAHAFLRSFADLMPSSSDRTIIICPPALLLMAAADALSNRPDILLGVQNIFWEEKGAFTGENSPLCARAAGARVALVGHSERRHVFGETDEETARKCAAAARADLIPIVCVGETIEQRESGQTNAIVLRQLRAALGVLRPDQVTNILVAYEPVWAIGTGKTAMPADAEAVHGVIRSMLVESVGAMAANVPILYGGSVSSANAAALLAQPQVDGLLVGGASLDPAAWAGICRA